ncbi:MAG: exodeoxyribonuclease VII small subunit [Odoribacter sp.]|nr:exodeoxyribonuclease VII small subunit [Bacteroidales bacterium]MBR2981091.1 exodeoxyribonuclease VII small subunit [Odoribacter sp.]
MENKLTYKEALAEIEQIVSNLENDKLDIDQLSVAVKRVTELIKFCKDKLKETSDEVEKTLQSLDL